MSRLSSVRRRNPASGGPSAMRPTSSATKVAQGLIHQQLERWDEGPF